MSAPKAKFRILEKLFLRPPLHTACSNPECHRRSRWQRLTRPAITILLHGSHFCFPKCFETEVRRLLEVKTVSVLSPRPKPRRIPLGLLMLSRGILTATQLRQALLAQQQSGTGKIGDWLMRLGLSDGSDVTAALASQWACPLMRTLPVRLPNHEVPLRLLRHFGMLPVHFAKESRVLHVAFASDIEYQALVCIEQILEIKTAACLTTESQLNAALYDLEGHGASGEKYFENCRNPEEIVRIISNYTARLASLEVRVAACGDFIWARILAANPTNLLFSRSHACIETAIIASRDIQTAAPWQAMPQNHCLR